MHPRRRDDQHAAFGVAGSKPDAETSGSVRLARTVATRDRHSAMLLDGLKDVALQRPELHAEHASGEFDGAFWESRWQPSGRPRNVKLSVIVGTVGIRSTSSASSDDLENCIPFGLK